MTGSKEEEEEGSIMERYCEKIANTDPNYRASISIRLKEGSRGTKEWEWIEEVQDMRIVDRPAGMSKEEWHTQKESNRRYRDELLAEQKLNKKLRENSATWVLHHRVGDINCYCTGEGLRNGRVCKLCKLARRVDDYMLNLFKDAAEGRRPE